MILRLVLAGALVGALLAAGCDPNAGTAGSAPAAPGERAKAQPATPAARPANPPAAASVAGKEPSAAMPAATETPAAIATAGPLLPLEEPPIWTTVTQVDLACEKGLAAAQARRQAILAVAGPRTQANTLQPYNEMLIEVDRVLPGSELTANVHPERPVRDAAERCQQRAMKFLSDLKLDRGLFEALAGLPAATLQPKARRFLEHLLRDYRRAGVDKDEATRRELARLNEMMVRTGQDFSRNIREDKRFIELSSAQDLEGLPADFVASHPPGEDGKIRISTDYPDFFPFQTYSPRGDLRRELYRTFLQRAYPANERILKKLLGMRHRYATLLGYSDWAAYNAEDKMVKRREVIEQFIERVTAIGRPRMQAELAQLLERKKKDEPAATTINVWDRFYYVRTLRSERFGVDAQKVRAYFPYPKVKAGILALAQELFQVRFVPVPGAKVWAPKVEAYDVFDGERRVARFYLDMHPRDGKYGHAAEFPMISGVPGVQVPAASLVCNFPDPADGGPALMEHSDATTFFHEFGHLMHQLLATQPWINQAGINCEWDFVEAPSQLLEEWTWDAQILRRFAHHHETGEPIPAELVAQMRQADELGKGVHVMRQMFYARLSFVMHAQDPQRLLPLDVMQEVQKGYSPYPYEPDTYTYCNFGHINGYSSMYYTYMWSLVLAKDLFTRFKAQGLLDAETARAYRGAVLEPGGAVDAADMVRTFLGREHTFTAFEEWLERG